MAGFVEESGSFPFLCGWFALQISLLIWKKPNWNPKPSNWLPASGSTRTLSWGKISKICSDPNVHHTEIKQFLLYYCPRFRVKQCLWEVLVITCPAVTLHWVTISTKDQPKISVRGAYPGNHCLLPYSKDKGQSTGPAPVLWWIESKSVTKVQAALIVHPEMPTGIVYQVLP